LIVSRYKIPVLVQPILA